MTDGWTITERGFGPATHKAWEGLFTLGGPGLHIRGSLEEPLREAPQDMRYWRSPANVTAEVFREKVSKWGTFIPGVYGPHPLLNNELINLPCALGLWVVVGSVGEGAGRRLTVEGGGGAELVSHERTLDLRRAVLSRRSVWRVEAPGGAGGAPVEIAVEHERFVHHTGEGGAGGERGEGVVRAGLLVQRMRVRADREIEIVVEGGIDARVTTNGYDHFTHVRCAAAGEVARCVVETDSADEITIHSALRGGQDRAEPLALLIAERAVILRRRVMLPAGEVVEFEKLSRYAVTRRAPSASSGPTSGASGAEMEADALPDLPELALGALLSEHECAWADRWATCNIELEGDPDSQIAIRAALFHLLRAHPGPESALAIDAKGYAGEAYWGRFFWDTEMFLLPFYCATDPARARALIDYRITTLPAARENAARRGQRGARFAWEADADGRECCPNFQYADHEIHITADVAYGAALLAAATGESLARGPLAELVIETGRFWLSRIDRRPGDTLPHLLKVMGPDEYTFPADDNAFTNRMARFNLDHAADALDARAGDDPSSAAEAQREAQAMREVAAQLPYAFAPGGGGGAPLQCEGFDRLPDPRFDELWTDRTRPFAGNVPQEWLYRSRCLKQADVLMLMALFPHEFSDAEVRAAWAYYLPLTTHDSSLSPAVHAIIAARLGLDDAVWQFWRRGSGLDLDVAHGGAAEGIHIAAAGGVWQMVMAFCGVQSPLWTERLTLAAGPAGGAALPRQWTRVAFPIVWRGQSARVVVERDRAGMRATIENRSQRPLAAEVWGQQREVAVGGREEFRTGETSVPPAPPSPSVRAVIFDLDGVLVTTDELHFRAWKAVAEAEGIAFTREDNHRLRGVSRMTSLDILLEKAPRRYSDEEKLALAERKNALYIESLATLGPEAILPGAIETLHALRARGIKTAVASSSRNARTILDQLALTDLLDAVVDGSEAARSKPAPDLFLLAARRLGVPPAACIVVEDAAAGVEAAVAAGMPVIAVGAAAGAGARRARHSAASLAELTPEHILAGP